MDKPIKTLKALKETLSAEEKKALRVATLKQKKFLASLVLVGVIYAWMQNIFVLMPIALIITVPWYLFLLQIEMANTYIDRFDPSVVEQAMKMESSPVIQSSSIHKAVCCYPEFRRS